jgi:type I restriction enzyme S subunit
MRTYPFSNVITDATSKFCKIKASDYKTEGRFKIIDQGQNDIAGYTDDESLINRTHSPIIVFGDHTRALKYEDSPIALGADGAKALSVNPAIANTLYVYYYLRTINLKEAGYSRHFKFLKQVEIPIPVKDGEPDFDDQKRIAHLLGKVEGLIARRKQHLQQLDDLLKSVFLEMFGEFLDDVGDSSLADCLKIQQGFAFKSTEFIEYGVPIIKIGTVNKGFFDYSTLSFIAEGYPEKIRRYEISPGDLLISLTGTVGKDDYGNTCFVPKKSVYPTYLLNQRVGKLICYKDVANPYFIDAFMTLPKVKSALIKQNRGIRQANLSNSDIYNIPLSIPPIDLQNQFAAIVEKVEGIKSRYQQSLTDLESLYGALSQKAFKGELDLSRVVLPAEDPEVAEEETTDIEEKQPMEPLFELPAPEELALLQTAEGRKSLLGEWLNAWLEHLGDAPFTAQTFMDAARQRLWELAEDDAPDWGAAEYDELKTQVFEALEQGRLIQGYDDANNRVQITALKG